MSPTGPLSVLASRALWRTTARGTRKRRVLRSTDVPRVGSRAADPRHAARTAPTGSDLETGFLEVQLAQYSVHRLVREIAVRSEPEQGFALGRQDDLDHLLVGERAVLVAVVLD